MPLLKGKSTNASELVLPLSRSEFRAGLISYFKVLFLSLLPGILLLGYGKYTTNFDFTIFGLFVLGLTLTLIQIKMQRKINAYGRLLDIYPELQKTKMLAFGLGAMAMVPLLWFAFLILLLQHQGPSKRPVPTIFSHPSVLVGFTLAFNFFPILVVFSQFIGGPHLTKIGPIAYWASEPTMSYIAHLSDEVSEGTKGTLVPEHLRKITTMSLILYTVRQLDSVKRKPSQEETKGSKTERLNNFLAQASKIILATDPDIFYVNFNPLYLLSSASMVSFVLIASIDEFLAEKISLMMIKKYEELKTKNPELNWQKFNSSIEESKIMNRFKNSKRSAILTQFETLTESEEK